MLPRHLPPTATPLPFRTLARSLPAPADGHERLRYALSETLGVKQCHFASTGRTALYLLLTALRQESIGQRVEVVLPAYTCPSLVKVILEAELVPRLVDISASSMVLKSDDLSRAVGSQTLAIIVVHPFGIPHDVEPVMALADSQGAVVIEDVAQSMGATLGSQYAGSRGHYGLFSLGPGKPLSAGGGGFVCANANGDAVLLKNAWQQLPSASRGEDWVATARLAAFQTAFEPHGWWLATKAGAQRVGEDEANWGFKLRSLSNAQAAVAAEQLPQLATINRRRQAQAATMIAALADLPGLTIPKAEGDGEAFYLRLPLLFEDPALCAQVHTAMQAAGIGSGRMYNRTLATIFPALAGGFPGAGAVAAGLLTLPTHHHVKANDLERMIGIVQNLVHGNRS